MSRTNRPAHRTFSRLCLERLEMREVPAVNTWVGDNSNFNEADNWTDGIPTPDDILVFGPMEAVGEDGPELPGEGGGTPGPGGGGGQPPPVIIGSHHSVTFPTTADLSYAGIRIINGYTGTITFPANISFAEYTQTSGNTSQAADTVVSISGTFSWVGGAINTSTNAATYKLLGATGQIGEDTTSLSSGSKFVLGSNTGGIGSTVHQAGVLTLLNDAIVEILENSTLQQQRINAQLGGDGPEIVGGVKIAGGKFYDNGGTVVWVHNLGGLFDVKAGGVVVTGKVPGTDWGVVQDSAAQGISFPMTHLLNGETIKATNGVYIKKGLFFTGYNPNKQQKPKIDGKFRIDDGEISLGTGAPQGTIAYTTLIVTDRTFLWGTATFFTKVDATNPGNRDAIETWEKFNVGANFTIQPNGIGGIAPLQNTPVLVSEDGFTDDVNPTNANDNLFIMERTNGGRDWSVRKAP